MGALSARQRGAACVYALACALTSVAWLTLTQAAQAAQAAPGPAANIVLTLQLQPNVVTADGSSLSTATATVTDASGNPVSGDIVTISSLNPGDRVFNQPPSGNVYTASIISSTQPGRSTITANDSTAGISTHQTLTGVPGSSTMNLVISPRSPVATNQNVTLFASVNPTGGTPDGTVTFLSGGFLPIAGCATGTITPSSTVATCQTSFPASSSPVQLSAIFSPDSASTVAGSSNTSALVVGPGSTSTSVGASSPTANVGAKETYTASVTPTYQGAVAPTGSVAFKNDGRPIHGCASVPVRASAGTASASCTVWYSTAGIRRVTAVYTGDHNFGGSSSIAIVVPVQALGRISSFMLWNFLHAPTYTSVTSMTVNGVSPGTMVIVTCKGQGCPFARRVSALSGGLRCTRTGKHRCGKGPIDLTGVFDRKRLKVGTRVTIEIRRPGWIGKFYSFVVVSSRSPQVHIGCVAPGLSKPGISC